jgi:NADH-quinone oxidoreductase subunit F
VSDTTRILLDFEGDRRDIHAYEQAGGYASLRKALTMEPGDVVGVVDGSGLRGRGGAGFPTGRKASFLPKDRKPAYLCVNADESEPGTFKDREIMLRNPHALIEGVLIMSFAIGATSAFIYIRGEYRTEFEVLRRALEDARSRGYVGLNVLGSGYNATVVLHRGAGAYICGEETALLSSLEGERGQPRSKPPFPRRSRRCRSSSRWAPRPTPRSARSGRRARASSRSRATCAGPGTTSCRSPPRCAT